MGMATLWLSCPLLLERRKVSTVLRRSPVSRLAITRGLILELRSSRLLDTVDSVRLAPIAMHFSHMLIALPITPRVDCVRDSIDGLSREAL